MRAPLVLFLLLALTLPVLFLTPIPTADQVAPGPGPGTHLPPSEARSSAEGRVDGYAKVGEAVQSPIRGTLRGDGPGQPALGAFNISLYARPCTGQATPLSCTFVNHTVTRPDGSFTINASKGAYFVVANASGPWSGAWQAVSVPAGASVPLRAYPSEPYGNATFVLPGWSDLSSTASNCNAVGPCGTGVYGTQDPLLSWTSDGVYYVNRTARLVFYSFENGTVRNVAPWLTLYDDVMYYQGIENTEWITADGAYVYEFGCLSDCASSSTSAVVFYAVNTTTGQTFRHTFGGLDVSSLSTNGQIQMIGEDGNTSIAALLTAGGTVYGYNLWNRTQWTLGTLSYFEANNAYWLPNLDSFLNVEAQGSSTDRLTQVELEGTAPGTSLVDVYASTYGSNFVCNGVNGVYVNVTDHEIGFTVLTGGGPLRTEFWQYDGRGLLDGNHSVVPETSFSSWPSNADPANIFSSEHRPTITSDGPMYNGIWDGMFGNNTWRYEPSTQEFLSTNVSFDHIGSNGGRQSSQSPASVESMFSNTSYSIVSESVNCRTNGTSCPIRGSAQGTVAGTVWWTWELGLPEFPFPSSAPPAETLPPAPLVAEVHNTTSSVGVNWTAPAPSLGPVLNYTVFWNLSGVPARHAVDVWGQNTSWTLDGVAPNASVSLCLEAWNLHWHNLPQCWVGTAGSSGNPLKVASFTSDRPRVDQGMAVVFTTTTVGGVGIPTFAYTGLPVGCTSGNVSSLRCVPDANGTFAVVVHVSDPRGDADTATVYLVVAPRFRASVTFDPSPIDLGASGNVTASAMATGTPPYTGLLSIGGRSYNVTPDGALPTTVTPPGPGAVPTQFVAVDALGRSFYLNGSWSVEPALQLSLVAFPAAADVEVPVAFTASSSYGTPPVGYSFGTVPGLCQSVSGAVLGCRFSSPGVFQVAATGQDVGGGTGSANASVRINPDPTFVSFGPSPARVVTGQPVTFEFRDEFGTGPYNVSVSGLPTGCGSPSSNGTTTECTPEVAGTYPLSATLTDADGRQANASALLVVSPVTPAPAGGSTFPTWEVGAGVGALGAVAVAAAVLGVRARRRRGPNASR